MASFLGMKFGTGWKTWDELVINACAEVESNSQWDPGLTLGMVLAELRRKKANQRHEGHDGWRERANEVVRPRRRKKQK